ncbi:two-component system, NtrC family, sensor kinase [Gammaproteobacteria bacterium]
MSRTVLVVDNECDTADSLAILLASYDFNTQVAYDTTEAERQLLRGETRVALVDVRLGTENGVRLMRRLRRLRPGLVCVMMTGFATIETALDALRNGAYDYLVKPMEPSDLLATLERCFERLRLADEREAALHALREREEEVRLLFDSTAEGIYGVDCSGKVTFANAACLRMLGYSLDDFLGHDAHALLLDTCTYRRKEMEGPGGKPGCTVVDEDDGHDAVRILEAVLREGCSIHVEYTRLRRCDGSTIATECWLHPIRRKREVVGSVITFVDVSERRSAIAETQRMKAYLKNIIDAMPSVLVGVDAKGRITEWNYGAEQETGVSANEAAGRDFLTLFPTLASQAEHVTAAIHGEGATHSARVTTEKEGRSQIADVVIYPVEVNRTRGAVIRIDDVTERVRIEQMMVQTEKMMSLGGMAAGMAHEINNPLSAILQGAQNITRRLSPFLPANRRAAVATNIDLEHLGQYLEVREITLFLANIQAAATRATRIVADMLAFSRCSEAHFAPFDITEILETVVRLAASDYDLRRHYDFRRIEIIRDYDPTLPRVPCDRTEIEQVFLNLIKNSAQALLEVSPPHSITLRTRCEDGYARIEVADTGSGMDDATRTKVFEPFFTTKPVGVGTGLGLSVSYFIVTEQHRGTISVTSESGRGTTFIVRLPLARANE